MSDFMQRLEDAMAAKGVRSIPKLRDLALPHLHKQVDAKTFRKWLLEEPEPGPWVVLVCALALDIRVADLSETAAAFWSERRQYLGPERRKRDNKRARAQRISPLRWTPIYAGELAAAC